MSKEGQGSNPDFLKFLENLALDDILLEKYSTLMKDAEKVEELKVFLQEQNLPNEIVELISRKNIKEIQGYVNSLAVEGTIFIIFIFPI